MCCLESSSRVSLSDTSTEPVGDKVAFGLAVALDLVREAMVVVFTEVGWYSNETEVDRTGSGLYRSPTAEPSLTRGFDR